MEKIKGIMEDLRKNPPKEIANETIVTIKDYGNSVATDTKTGEQSIISLPVSNVLAYHLNDGSSLIVRPSGTEPKIKIYMEAVGSSAKDAEAKQAALLEAGTALLGF